MNRQINLPGEVKYIMDTLAGGGHEAFAVGGCVRDRLLDREPKDWDVCTPALPEQAAEYFEHVINTGLKYGTVTVMLNGKPFEVTTYRADGDYSDNRRPDTVTFGTDLGADLARRDFTVNAMAYSPETGVVDCFGGAADLEAGIIRCVGNPSERFREDALRIMRALRFASALEFTIEPETSKAVFGCAGLLKNIAAERIAAELNGLLTGGGSENILSEYRAVLSVIIPDYRTEGISKPPPLIIPRLAVLLSGLGADGARDILSDLRYDNRTADSVAELIYYGGADIRAEESGIKRWLNKIGEEQFRLLLEVGGAVGTCGDTEAVQALLEKIFSEKQCFSLKDLAVCGMDLIESGIPEGVEVGVTLNRLLNMVIDGKIENSREALLGAVLLLAETEHI